VNDVSNDSSEVAFVARDEQVHLARLARRVASDLAKVGLVINWEGNYADGNVLDRPGVRVFYDPVVGSPAGVYVKWMMPRDFLGAAVAEGPEGPMLHIAAAWLETMMGALERLLVAAGWEVDSVNVGVHETSIRIIRPTSNPFAELDA
jgi:hypothetical protein